MVYPEARIASMKVSLLLNSESAEPQEEPAMGPPEHALMTPASINADSPRPETYRSVGEELKLLTSQNLLKSHVQLKFPDVDWNEIVRYVGTLTLPTDFTRPEIELIVLEWYKDGPVNHRMLERECFARTRREIHLKICALEDLYGPKRKELLCLQTTAMEVCYELELFLLNDVREFLPHLSSAEIAAMISKHYKHKHRWLTREMDFISDSLLDNKPVEYIQENLVFRKPYEIKVKVEAIRKKLGRESQEVSVAPPREESPLIAAYDKEISILMKSDLTLTGIRLELGTRSTKIVIREIRDRIERHKKEFNEPFPFTKAETDFLRESLINKSPTAEIMKELVVRSEQEIEAKLKTLEIACVRQKKFKNYIERLIYEAQWYASIADSETGGRSRRRTRNDVVFDDLRKEALTKKIKAEKSLTPDPELLTERKNRRDLRTKNRIEMIRKKAEDARIRKLNAATRMRKLRSSTKTPEPKSSVTALLEEARWFQSVTGDGTTVKEGEKRKRKPVFHLVPEFKSRQQLKFAQRKIMEIKMQEQEQKKQEKKTKKRGRGRPRLHPTPEIDETTEDSGYESSDGLEKLKNVIDSEDIEELVSAFDPTDIFHDTMVPLHDRQLFNNAITSGSANPQPVSFSDDGGVMVELNHYIPVNDTVAARVIKSHIKSYKCLGSTFPPLFAPDMGGAETVNSRNIVHIRYLLYPEHTEQFVLAAPKNNELDSVFELQKIFQIHYSLYFSHSPVIKDIIMENYVGELAKAVENDDFSHFMKVIDHWNLLMLVLSPYPIKFDPSIDINEGVRVYLPPYYKFQPTVQDLKLDIFYSDVLAAGELKGADNSPSTEFATSPLMPPSAPIKDSNSALANIITRFRNLRPIYYPSAFMRLLKRVTEISRFAIQQILLRAYTRIVSPNSRKLRNYKAFTAEVYGELLPSFVSEVLTKVELKPEHKFYDLGSGVGNTTFQAALEFGVKESGGCEVMSHASELTVQQEIFLQKQLMVLGMSPLNLNFSLNQSFVDNRLVRQRCVECDILIVNNYLFDFLLNVEVGKLLYGMKPGSKIISLKSFIPPRYKAGKEKTIFDYLKVERFEMSDYLSVSWTANKVPYYISTVQPTIQEEYI